MQRDKICQQVATGLMREMWAADHFCEAMRTTVAKYKDTPDAWVDVPMGRHPTWMDT